MPGVGSGVTVMDDCVKEFENMKKSRANRFLDKQWPLTNNETFTDENKNCD